MPSIASDTNADYESLSGSFNCLLPLDVPFFEGGGGDVGIAWFFTSEGTLDPIARSFFGGSPFDPIMTPIASD